MVFGFIPVDVWNAVLQAFKYIYMTLPIWLPVAFFVATFNAWIRYKRSQFWQKQGHVLLEIKLPREINKSPAAMEVALGAFFQPGGEGTWLARILEGKTRAWFSLEIVSVGGTIRFFIWTRPQFRNTIETNIYAQYPGVEIYEAEDYSKPFYYDPDKFGIYGAEFALTKKDAYPIKTYVDYGLHTDPKEEYKVDPITPLLELLGSITAGQNIWIQIIIRAHKKRRLWGVFGEKEDQWKDDAIAEKNKIIESLKGRLPTKGESETIAALERSISKLPYDVGIRAVYITEKDKFNGALIGGILGIFKQFGSLDLNGFRPAGWLTIFDYPWQEWFNAKEKLKPILLEEYKLRRYFFSPYMGKKFYSKPFVLNAEELATLYHLPGEVAATPTLERIPSVKSEAPPNLPI
jgi:hypothetical protein